MTPDDRWRAVCAVTDAVPAARGALDLPDRTCILSTRLGIATLRALGVSASPLAVGVTAFNRAAHECAVDAEAPLEGEAQRLLDAGAHLVQAGYGAPSDDPGWDGHIVAVVRNPDAVLDLSAGAMSRPHRSILLPPALAIPWPNRPLPLEVEVPGPDEGDDPTYLLYVPRPDDRTYRRAGDWWRRDPELDSLALRLARRALDSGEAPRG